ncbi:MAG: anti-sigma factor [Chloroflexota bacterium]|nr:anti-sigma factor [Chloroflexota bacterium]MDE2885780.1 anti-sigma factor [Chloroflexota bacterium]
MADEPAGLPGDDVADLLPAYALGALDAADALVVERALDREPRYRELLEQHLESVAALTGSHAFAVPSSQVRERVMGRVRATATTPAARPAPRVPFALLGVAAALAVGVMGLGAFSTVQQQRVAQLQDEVDVVTAEAEDVRSDLVGLSDMVADSVAMTPLTPAQPVEQPGPPDAAADGPSADNQATEKGNRRYGSRHARGILITRPDGQSMLVVRGLSALEPGLIYRAWWWDTEHQTRSAAVFTVGEDGYAWVRLLGHADGMSRLGVSVESEMGAVEPGPQLVLHAHVHVVEGGGEAGQ